jgi:hypothetical protein
MLTMANTPAVAANRPRFFRPAALALNPFRHLLLSTVNPNLSIR